MLFLTYYAYFIWQCYKIYTALYVLMCVYGFSKTTFKLTYSGFSKIVGLMYRKNNYIDSEHNIKDDWVIIGEDGVADCVVDS